MNIDDLVHLDPIARTLVQATQRAVLAHPDYQALKAASADPAKLAELTGLTMPISLGLVSAVLDDLPDGPLCRGQFSSCICSLPDGHEAEVHECLCGGSWTGSGDDLHPVTFPGGRTKEEAVAGMVDRMLGDPLSMVLGSPWGF